MVYKVVIAAYKKQNFVNVTEVFKAAIGITGRKFILKLLAYVVRLSGILQSHADFRVKWLNTSRFAWGSQSRDAITLADTQISMADAGQPTQNALVERFMRTFKEEHLDYAEYDDFEDAQRQMQHWLEVTYMTERIHSALDYLTPAEFEAQASLHSVA